MASLPTTFLQAESKKKKIIFDQTINLALLIFAKAMAKSFLAKLPRDCRHILCC